MIFLSLGPRLCGWQGPIESLMGDAAKRHLRAVQSWQSARNHFLAPARLARAILSMRPLWGLPDQQPRKGDHEKIIRALERQDALAGSFWVWRPLSRMLHFYCKQKLRQRASHATMATSDREKRGALDFQGRACIPTARREKKANSALGFQKWMQSSQSCDCPAFLELITTTPTAHDAALWGPEPAAWRRSFRNTHRTSPS